MSENRMFRLMLARIEGFLVLNYPCRCGDEHCPGSYYEARAIVEIVRGALEREKP